VDVEYWRNGERQKINVTLKKNTVLGQ
jgi:hypothetical protein